MSEPTTVEIEQDMVKEVSVDPEVAQLQKIFGTESKIERDGTSFKVNSTLKDGLCPGEQHLEVKLTKLDRIELYQASEFLINEAPLQSLFGVNFFFKIPSEPEQITDKKDKPGFLSRLSHLLKHKEDEDEEPVYISHLKKFSGTKAHEGGQIVIVNLEDADGLAAIFHEIGHTRDETPQIFNEFNVDSVRKFLQRDGKGYTKDELDKIHGEAEEVLGVEMFANKMAIKIVKYAREKGYEFFKTDEELHRLKKFLITTTTMRFYKAPKFIELVGKERINEILKI